MKRLHFRTGDKVIYTNDQGVCWGEKTVVRVEFFYGRNWYFITPTDTPWCGAHARELRSA